MGDNSTPDPRGDYGPAIWPPLGKLEALLSEWAAQHADVMALDVAGRSVQGRPVYAVRLTDPDASDADKEHALITALHSGVERNGATTVFAIMEWLLSGDEAARDILRRQVVLCMPVPNPAGYVAGDHGRVYSDWTLDGPRDPAAVPEAAAVQRIMDEHQPEVHADVHGLSMDFERYIMLENSGSSYSNLALRSYHRDVIRQMDAAALAEGYPSDRQESDAERIFWGPELEAMSHKLWVGRPPTYAATYCYDRYHTLLSASEVCWERSGLLRHRRLLEIGNETWPGEHYPGYPTRVIASNNYHMVTAYGQTASDRRRSRVELWSKLRQITHGMCDPMVEGKIVYVCATSPSARERWLSHEPLDAFSAGLAAHSGADHEPIERFVAGWPSGQNRPQAYLALQHATATDREAAAIEHGLALRLRIPYAAARITDLRLNGHPVPPSETDGYLTWTGRGYRYVQLNIPPSRSAAEDLFVVTCAYDPGEKRTHWTGWR